MAMNWDEELKHRSTKFLHVENKTDSYTETYENGSTETFTLEKDTQAIDIEDLRVIQEYDLLSKEVKFKIVGDTVKKLRSIGTEGSYTKSIEITSDAAINVLVIRQVYSETGMKYAYNSTLTLGLDQSIIIKIIDDLMSAKKARVISIEIPGNTFYKYNSFQDDLILPYWQHMDIIEETLGNQKAFNVSLKIEISNIKITPDRYTLYPGGSDFNVEQSTTRTRIVNDTIPIDFFGGTDNHLIQQLTFIHLTLENISKYAKVVCLLLAAIALAIWFKRV